MPSSTTTTTDPNHKRNQTIRAQSIRSFMDKFGMTQHEAIATVDSEMARLYAPNPWEVANRCGLSTRTPEARCEERKEEVKGVVAESLGEEEESARRTGKEEGRQMDLFEAHFGK